jgi:hypothetical protein
MTDWDYARANEYDRLVAENDVLSRKLAVCDGCLDIIRAAAEVADIARDAETAEDVDDAERAMADLTRGGVTEHTFV